MTDAISSWRHIVRTADARRLTLTNQHNMEWLKKLLLLNVLAVVVADTLFSNWGCPDHCQCDWIRGYRSANCSYAGLSEIPTITPVIQVLNFTGNTVTEITRRTTQDSRLYNLKKLVLRDCKLTKIYEHGLRDLDVLIELDLSKNYLKTLRNNTFQELVKIRSILLNDNQLEKLEDGLFSNLSHLNYINLSNNSIFQIGVSSFVSVPRLSHIKLDNNKLVFLNVDTFSNLSSLSKLELNDNPWHCDCKLQPLWNRAISKNLFVTHNNVTCAEPANLHGKSWKDLDPNDFACQPDTEDIVSTTESNKPYARVLMEIPDTEITLGFEVNGQPINRITWGRDVDWEVKYYKCGDYICMFTGRSEQVIKIAKVPNPSAVGKNE